MSLQGCCVLQLGTVGDSRGVEIGVGDLIARALVKQSVTKARAVHNCSAAEGPVSMLVLEIGAVSGGPGSAATQPVCPDLLGAVRGCPGPAGAGAQGYCPLDGHAASRLCSPLLHHKHHPHQQHEVAGLQACVTPVAVCRPAVRRRSATKQGIDPLYHDSCLFLVGCRATAGLLTAAHYVPQTGQGVVKLGDLMRFGPGADWGAAAVVRQLAAVAKQLEEAAKQLGAVVKQVEAVVQQLEAEVKQLEAVVEQLEEVVKQLEEVVQLLGELVKQFEAVVQLFEAVANHL